MKKSLYSFLPVLLLLLAAISLNANNIQVSNTKLTGQNTTDGYTLVQFNLSWENSWRTSSAPFNWDAAWVFVKYRITAANGGDDLWKHAWLNNSGHNGGTGTGATIDAGLLTPGSAFDATTNPGLGVFIYRSGNGTGTFSITGAQLRWNYGANGVADNATVDVQVFAIEMVYVPQGAFYVGSGGDESGRFKDGTTNNPFLINSEGALEIGNEDGKLWGSSTLGDNTIGDAGTLAASFPKGFAAFYMQKYEITQQQYVDFLNTLTYNQQNARVAGSPNASAGTFTNNLSRHKIKIHTSGVASTTPAIYETEHPYLACNFLSWMDGAAYSDWAGLRPMTELEFEKASRGTIEPVAGEYAWGNTSATAANDITNPGAANETTNTSGANAVFANQTNVQGPMRVGVFAQSATTREQSGASYYGIMELSGNLWERAVTVGDATVRAFTGVHGDGILSANGHANQTAWPGLSFGQVIDATGSGFRGGSWINVATLIRVSDRSYAAYWISGRDTFSGFRAVRLAP